jgi:hypothetical protein
MFGSGFALDLTAGIQFGFSHAVFAIYTGAEEPAVFLSLLPQSLVKLRTNQLLLWMNQHRHLQNRGDRRWSC